MMRSQVSPCSLVLVELHVWPRLAVQICCQWVSIVLNLGMHVLIYAYFALHALGFRFQWKVV